MLVTSRNLLTGLVASHSACLLTLDVLTESEAVELLERRLGRGRTGAEPAAVAELAGLCARLPLALSVAAARAVAQPGLPLAVLAGELRDTRARLDGLGTDDAATDVRTVFSWSCQQLSKVAARLFRLLGVHPGTDIAIPAAASLAALPLAQAGQALGELTRAHLLTEHAAGRYAFHDLLRAYAAEQAGAVEDSGSRRAALRRVLDHYLHTACAAARLLNPYRDQIALSPALPQVRPEPIATFEQALEWFSAEWRVLLGALGRAAGEGFPEHTWKLFWAAATFLFRNGYLREEVAAGNAALAAARQLGDQAGQAADHRRRAVHAGRPAGSHGQGAVAADHPDRRRGRAASRAHRLLTARRPGEPGPARR